MSKETMSLSELALASPVSKERDGHLSAAESVVSAPSTPAAHLSIDFKITHPLQDIWTWWFDSPKRKAKATTWGDNLKKIYTFSTVEDFWSLWNNIKGSHELAQGSNYHLFKEGVEPKWEDPQNAQGGKWVVQLKPSQRATSLNQLWLWAVLACIGATFEDNPQILGVVVSVRKAMDKISLWTANASDEVAVRRIGRQFKEILQLGPATKIVYQAHADALDSNTSYYNMSRYEL